MDYPYSILVDPSTYDTQGLCDEIPLRKLIAADLEEVATFKAYEDWERFVGPVGDYKGSLGPNFSLVSVIYPACLPERIEAISYLKEITFLLDDVIDGGPPQLAEAAKNDLLTSIKESGTLGLMPIINTGFGQVIAKGFRQLIEIDREKFLINARRFWQSYERSKTSKQLRPKFKVYDDYIAYRIIDVGYYGWGYLMISFACDLLIPDEETDLADELTTPAVVAVSLINDLISYQNDIDEAEKAGDDHVKNAVWVIMKENDITLEEASQRCRTKIKEETSRYLEIVRTSSNRADISLDLRRYLEYLQYTIVGSTVWSLNCPRYNKGIEYNELQQLRKKHGIEKYPALWQLAPNPDTAPGDTAPGHTRNDSMLDISKTADLFTQSSNDSKSDRLDESLVPDKADSSSCVSVTSNAEDVISLALKGDIAQLDDHVIMDPINYLDSLPSKGVRNKVIDALNMWLKVPAKSVETIKTIIAELHHASLMLDDIEDGSSLRRGEPAAHQIYGQSQTINSAAYLFPKSGFKILTLRNQECMKIFLEELQRLFIGQSFDINWTHGLKCPSFSEYLSMIDDKTGGLFRMLVRLMAAESSVETAPDLGIFAKLLARYFQIRDDYMNLQSSDYAKQKGFAEDLDEGKYSLLLIHLIQAESNNMQLQGLLMHRRVSGKLGVEQKKLILKLMEKANTFECTLSVLTALYDEIDREIGRLEVAFGLENNPLRLLVTGLKV